VQTREILRALPIKIGELAQIKPLSRGFVLEKAPLPGGNKL
jgi:hypothetical protein